jgi:hypothetical protein
MDDEAIAVANGVTCQDVCEILAEVDPRHGDRIQVAMHD